MCQFVMTRTEPKFFSTVLVFDTITIVLPYQKINILYDIYIYIWFYNISIIFRKKPFITSHSFYTFSRQHSLSLSTRIGVGVLACACCLWFLTARILFGFSNLGYTTWDKVIKIEKTNVWAFDFGRTKQIKILTQKVAHNKLAIIITIHVNWII